MSTAGNGRPPGVAGALAAVWGVGGVVLLLGQAVWRLTPLAVEALRDRLTAAQASVLALWVAFSLYAEGYRGFHRRFSPRVVARAVALARAPRAVHGVLAPLYCMAFFHATRRAQAVAWGITLMVVALVVLVHRLPQPWRGIVDAGVVVGLAWGIAAILWFAAEALRGRPLPVSDESPAARATGPDA